MLLYEAQTNGVSHSSDANYFLEKEREENNTETYHTQVFVDNREHKDGELQRCSFSCQDRQELGKRTTYPGFC